MIKQLSFVFTLIAFSFLQSLAQTAPTALTANNITANTTTVSWVASTAALSTSVRAEGFEQPFGTKVWSNGGYDWFFDHNDDIREYNGGAHTGASSWYVRGYADRSNLFCNIPLNIKGFWANFYNFSSSNETYTIKGFSETGVELYSKIVSAGPFGGGGFEYVSLNWENVKKININYRQDPNLSLRVDDLEFTPAANAYPYYLSTSNTAPSNNTAATSVATGTSINLSNLQPSTTYYLWMRTYNGDSYGNWTVSPLSFTTAPQVLPIELKSLQAEVKGNNLLVNWQTSSERNNSHFFVQVSANGRTWTDVAKVASKAANGNAAAELSYTFSFPLGQIALAGFGLLGLFLLPATRNKWLRLLMVALVIGGMASCAKTSELSDELNNGLKTGQTLYVRLAQVDLNGAINYTEAVLVKR